MPFVLTKVKEEIRLDKTVTDMKLLFDLIQPCPAEAKNYFPVSSDVNNIRNNDLPELLKKLIVK